MIVADHTLVNTNSAFSSGGKTFSAGERQLLSFARALVFDPAILILDEATSSIDTHTEELIQEALIKLTKGRTRVVIAHRLSTIQKADKIIVMHKGKLAESGTHQELLQHKGLYHKLYELQYKDKETAASDCPSSIVIRSARRPYVSGTKADTDSIQDGITWVG